MVLVPITPKDGDLLHFTGPANLFEKPNTGSSQASMKWLPTFMSCSGHVFRFPQMNLVSGMCTDTD